MSKKDKITNEFGDIYGYVRVSTTQQKEDRQLDALEEYGVKKNKIFVDKVSGKTFNRPAYKKLIRIIRKGDIIVIKSLDRLGRNYTEIRDQWRLITEEIGCGIHVIDMPSLNTTGDQTDLINRFVSNMILEVLSFVAQNERETTIKRQQEGIAAAKRRRKVKIGRPKKNIPLYFFQVYIMWKQKKMPTKELFDFCHDVWGISNRTFYRRLYEIDQRFGDLDPDRLDDLVYDEEWFDGIPFDNERLEAGINHYNSYCLHSPEKAEKERQRKKEKEKLMESISPHWREDELQAMILEQRKKRFDESFNLEPETQSTNLIYCDTREEAFSDIMPLNSYYHGDPNEKMPTKLRRKKKKSTESIHTEAIIIYDRDPVIPEQTIELQKPTCTIQVM